MPEDDFDLYGELDTPMTEQNEVRLRELSFLVLKAHWILTRCRVVSR